MIKLHPSIAKAESWERTALLLRRSYNHIVNEEIPDRFKRLLDKLK